MSWAGLGVSNVRVSGINGVWVRRLCCMGQKVVVCGSERCVVQAWGAQSQGCTKEAFGSQLIGGGHTWGEKQEFLAGGCE